jgi:hypothetical protein
METVDSLREDTNLSSQTAKNAIAMDVFASVMEVCDTFLMPATIISEDEELLLED